MIKVLRIFLLFILTSCFGGEEGGSSGGGLFKDHQPVDNSIPSVSIISPATNDIINIANNTAAFSIIGTCNKNNELVTITIDSVAATAPIGFTCNGSSFSGTIDTTVLGEGTLSFEATMDTATSDTVRVIKDTIAPSVSIDTLTNINNTNVNTYALSGTCDEASGTVNVELGGQSNSATCDGSIWSISAWDVSSEADANGINVTADLNDAAGNSAIQAADTVDKDTTIDGVSLNALATINIANVLSYTIDGTCSNDGEAVTLDIASATITDSQNCSGGAFSFSLDVSSVADNASIAIQVDHGTASDTTSVLKDTIAPTIAINALTNIDSTNVATYSLSGTCDEVATTVNISLGGLSNTTTCDGTNWSIASWDVSSEADATGIAVTADITDAAGNPASQASSTVDKNTTVYSVSIISAVAINNSNQNSYTVSGNCSTDGEAVNLDIGGATVTDSQNCSGGAFNFTLDVSSVADNAAVVIQVDHGNANDSINALKDTIAPSLDSNSISANTYSLGNTISISVDYSEAVIVSGSPRIELTFESQSSSPLYATLASGNGTSTLTFEYDVASGDNDANGILIASSIDLNSGSIRDAATNDATITLATTSFPSVLVDSAAPYITSFVEPADGTYADGGGELLFQVNFSENVNVTGSPEISINIGGSTVAATYKSGSGTSGLEFSYLIQAGDNDADGITLNSSSIQNGGIVASSDSDPAALEFGTYLNSMSGVLIDTSGLITAPNQVTGVTTAPTTSNTELSVAWSVPNNNGTAIINYSVQYREQGTSTWLNVTPNPTSNSTTVNGLSSGVTYEIRVAANNGLLGPYSATSTAEIFDVLALNPVAWLSSTNITNGGSEPTNGALIDQWEDLTGAASAATEANPANQPVYQTNAQNGLPAVRFDNLDRGLQGTFTRSVGTDLTFIVVGQFDNGSTDKCLFEFDGGGGARGFFIDRRYASNNNYNPGLTKGSFQLWRIEDSGGNATVTEGGSTQLYSGATNFNTDFIGTGNYVLGDDITGGNRMNGFIGEFLVFDRALTPSEISTLETYLINKWGL